MIEITDITKKNNTEKVDVNDVALVDENDEADMKADFDDVNETYCNTCIHEKDCKNDCIGYEEKPKQKSELDKVIEDTINKAKEKITSDDVNAAISDLANTIRKAVEKKMDNNTKTTNPDKKTKKFTIGFFGLIGIGIIAKTIVKVVEISKNKK